MAENKKIKIKTKHHIYGRTQNCAGISALASLKAASATDLQIAVVLQVLSHIENKRGWDGDEATRTSKPSTCLYSVWSP